MVLHGRDETFATKYPKTAALIAACERLGEPAAWPKDGPSRASAESAIGAQEVALVAVRVVAAIRETSKPWLGHHLAVIRGVSTAPPGRARPPELAAAALPVIDLAWLDQVPEPRRAEARAAWDAKRLEVETGFRPDAHPRVLASSASALRQEYAP